MKTHEKASSNGTIALNEINNKNAPTESTGETNNKASIEDDDRSCSIPLNAQKLTSDTAELLTRRIVIVLKWWAILATLMSVILLPIVIILAIHVGAVRYCLYEKNVLAPNNKNPGVFEDMTPQEFKAVIHYMSRIADIGLVPIETATVNSSYIYMIDLHIPLKPSVLEYLDRGSVILKRAAKVVVVRGDLETPRVEEYLVSPLPEPSSHRLARNPSYARFPIPYVSRPTDQVDYKYLYKIITKFSEQIYHILMESFGLSYHNCKSGANCIIFQDVAPRGMQSGDRSTWFWTFRDVEGYYLYPLGLELQINHKSTNTEKWHIDRIVYNGHLVYTVEDLLERYAKNELTKVKLRWPTGNYEELYSSFYRRGTSEMTIPLQGPKFVEPDGHRFKITGQHVRYMHWDFDVRMRPSTGIQLFDIRFESERIAYEISLQDGVVFSSGFGPSQTTSNIYLASWMIGASSFELVPGVDCPDTASFLSTHHLVNSGKPILYRNVICIYELNPGIPLRRHYSNNVNGGYNNYGGIVDYQLIVRHIASIRNSDYIFDYIFHLNGEIQMQVSSTGYVQATFKIPFEKPYGNTIYQDVIANIYQNIFQYKIDLDVGRLENRFSVLDINTETIRHPWYPNVNKTQLSIVERKMEREMDILFEEASTPKMYIVFDDKHENKYKSRRAYRIINAAETKFLLQDVSVSSASKWANYPIVVTRYDDTEDQSSSIYAQNDPWHPVVDFERFVLDNDTIVNEDLVVWTTIGLYHIPHTEDIPSTSTPSNKQSVHLVPYNFFTECPSVSSPNIVYIRPSSGFSHIEVNTFGMDYEHSCVQPSYGPKTYYGYRPED